MRRGVRAHGAAGCTSPPRELRNGDADARARRSVELVRGLPQEEVEPCIRACALQLQLANIAEERERVRRRRHYDATGVRQRESLMEAADLLRDEGADLAAALRSLHVELVLTAHPTEATRRSVLDHQLHVARLLDGLDDPRIGRSRRRALLSELREALTIWWQTDEVRRVRPMVEDEVRRNLFFFEATLHDAVPEVLEELERCFEVRVDGRELAFGSWAGSDMDGHPEVGAETLARTLDAAPRDRAAAAARQRRPARAELLALLAPHAGLPRAGGVAGARRGRAAVGARAAPREPRSSSRCAPSSASSPTGSRTCSTRSRASPATATRRSCATTSGSCSRASARRTSRTAACAGCCGRSTCSASTSPSLDVRQSASVVQEAVATLLPGYRDADEEERLRLLEEAIARAAARAARGARRARRASCCACSTRSRSRARRTASAPCR